MSIINNLISFLKRRTISFLLPIIIVEAILLLFLSFREPRLDTFLQFIGELTGVIFAIIIGFEFERFSSNIRFQNEIKKIFLLVKEELGSNRPRLIHIIDEGFTSSLPWTMQTTTWDIYEEKLGEAATQNVEDLTKIYHKLNLLNKVIAQENHLIPIGKGPHRQEYREIAAASYDEINKWIKLIDRYYEL